MQTILIADDSDAVLNILSRALAAPGRRILSAKRGDTALILARQQCPDVIVLDVLMPGRDGRQVCRDLREHPATRGIPVLMLTGLSDPAHEADGRRNGADDYVGKPFNPGELNARVSALLERGPQAPPRPPGVAQRLRTLLSARQARARSPRAMM